MARSRARQVPARPKPRRLRILVMRHALLVGLLGCGAQQAAGTAVPKTGPLLLRGAEVVGVGTADVEIEDGRIVGVGRVEPRPDTSVLDLPGKWIAPQVIDSHV